MRQCNIRVSRQMMERLLNLPSGVHLLTVYEHPERADEFAVRVEGMGPEVQPGWEVTSVTPDCTNIPVPDYGQVLIQFPQEAPK